MTPYRKPEDDLHFNFNRLYSRDRARIEMTFGLLKRRFACLTKVLRMSIQRVPKTILACILLHNFAIATNDEIPPILYYMDSRPQPEEEAEQFSTLSDVSKHRDTITENLL